MSLWIEKGATKGFEPSHFHFRKSADGVVERFNHEVGVYSWDALANMVNEDVGKSMHLTPIIRFKT